MLGLVFASVLGRSSMVTIGTAAMGLLMFAAFVWRQLRADSPLLPMSLFRSASVSIGTVLTLLAFGMFGALFFLTIYLQVVHGFTPLQAGLQLLPLTLLLAAGPPVASRVIDRFGLRAPMLVAVLVAAAALFGLSTMSSDTPAAWISLWLALLADCDAAGRFARHRGAGHARRRVRRRHTR